MARSGPVRVGLGSRARLPVAAQSCPAVARNLPLRLTFIVHTTPAAQFARVGLQQACRRAALAGGVRARFQLTALSNPVQPVHSEALT